MGILIILIGLILVWLVTRGNHSQNNTNNTAIQKSSSPSKDDETVKKGILANMEVGKRYTIGDMLVSFDCFDAGTSPQYISRLLSQMGAKGTGEIIRSEERGKAYFSLAQQPIEDYSSNKTEASSLSHQETKRNSGNSEKQLTPEQQKNKEMMHGILANMEVGKRYTIGDMLMSFDCFEPTTSPMRVSALLSKLGVKGTGEIVRTEENGKAYFSLSADSKPEKQLTPQQQKDEEMMRTILANMEVGKRYTIGDMLMSFDCFEPTTSPMRVSALLSKLGAKGTGEVIRTEERGKAYFSLAGDEVNNTQNSQGTVLETSPSVGQNNTSTETGQYKSYSEQSSPYSAPYQPTAPSWEEPYSPDENMSNGKPTVYLDEISLRRDLQNYLGTAAYSGFPMAGMDVMRMRSMDTKEVMALADHMGFDLNKYIMDIRYE